ncbi:hypothetical protein RN001_003294 [Aquatica leii]|uniref:Uncharacterized protein n=1 Tax=Aquatica leii TaxID=1421715 RepID=A0AAN7SRJ4_9COLE|nr:hypothetical protein RN001_003294 [Aquatica leii]
MFSCIRQPPKNHNKKNCEATYRLSTILQENYHYSVLTPEEPQLKQVCCYCTLPVNIVKVIHTTLNLQQCINKQWDGLYLCY